MIVTEKPAGTIVIMSPMRERLMRDDRKSAMEPDTVGR